MRSRQYDPDAVPTRRRFGVDPLSLIEAVSTRAAVSRHLQSNSSSKHNR